MVITKSNNKEKSPDKQQAKEAIWARLQHDREWYRMSKCQMPVHIVWAVHICIKEHSKDHLCSVLIRWDGPLVSITGNLNGDDTP